MRLLLLLAALGALPPPPPRREPEPDDDPPEPRCGYRGCTLERGHGAHHWAPHRVDMWDGKPCTCGSSPCVIHPDIQPPPRKQPQRPPRKRKRHNRKKRGW